MTILDSIIIMLMGAILSFAFYYAVKWVRSKPPPLKFGELYGERYSVRSSDRWRLFFIVLTILWGTFIVIALSYSISHPDPKYPNSLTREPWFDFTSGLAMILFIWPFYLQCTREFVVDVDGIRNMVVLRRTKFIPWESIEEVKRNGQDTMSILMRNSKEEKIWILPDLPSDAEWGNLIDDLNKKVKARVGP